MKTEYDEEGKEWFTRRNGKRYAVDRPIGIVIDPVLNKVHPDDITLVGDDGKLYPAPNPLRQFDYLTPSTQTGNGSAT